MWIERESKQQQAGGAGTTWAGVTQRDRAFKATSEGKAGTSASVRVGKAAKRGC